MAKPGPEPLLTEELTLKIRTLYFEGKKYIQIQEALDIKEGTWDSWVYKDYMDFRKKLREWKREMFLKKAEKVSNDILDSIHLDDDSKNIDKELLRIKQKESEFLRSTLGKGDGYSSKGDDALDKIADKAIITDEQFNRIIRARAEKLDSEEISTGGTD